MDLTPVMTRRTVGVRWPSALRRSRPSPRRSAGPRRSASCWARRSRRIRARGTTPTPTPGCSRTSHRRSTRTAPATHATATIALNAALGFNCYRFGIEWSRIEPSPGQFSDAELDHYERVLQTCHAHGQTPIVTFNHFSAPLWFAERGGWEQADAADLFARYCERTTGRLGSLIGRATTFNEANVQLLVQVVGALITRSPVRDEMFAAARRATGSDHFSSLAYSDPDVSQPILLDAHRKAYQAIKASRSALPVGLSLTTQQIVAVGDASVGGQGP